MAGDKSYAILSAEEAASLILTEITRNGRVYLTTGIGNAPTFLDCAMLPDLNLAQFQARHVMAAE